MDFSNQRLDLIIRLGLAILRHSGEVDRKATAEIIKRDWLELKVREAQEVKVAADHYTRVKPKGEVDHG